MCIVVAQFITSNDVQAQCSFTVSTSVTNVSCFNGTNGSVTISVTGGTTPYQYQLAEGGAGAWQSATNIYPGLSAGTYPVSVKDATGCIRTSYITVTQPTALNITYTATDATCAGANNGTITSTVTGGVQPYSYNWVSNGTTYSTQPNLTNLAPGNYNLIVTDANGCTKTPIIVSQAKAITVTGFNADGVANGTNASSSTSTSTSMDASPGYVLYSSAYTNTGGQSNPGGLPASGSFNSAQDANRPYQLAAYTGNNELLLRSSTDNAAGGATSGTLSFQTAFRSQYSTLYVLGTTGSGTGSINYTINFADATTATGAITFPDWYYTGTTNVAIGSLSRINRASGIYETSNNGKFNLFEVPIAVSVANQNKIINSVSFAWAGSGSARTNIFGISGYNSDLNGIRINDGLNVTVTPSVTITSNATSNTFCSGQSVTFTANTVNAGSSPVYQWKLNGVNVGTNSPTYTNNTLTNNDKVTVTVTSSLVCVSPGTVSSNQVTMISGTAPASVSIDASSTSVCSGSPTTFTATPVNGGTSPVYQWKLNGVNVGTNSATYINSSLVNGDQVSAVMTSSIACAIPNPSVSNIINMSVTENATPAVTIVSVPLFPTPGIAATFTATGLFGGLSPAYQWFKNGVAINGATSATLYVASPAVNDIYSARLTSNFACLLAPAAMSNFITVTNSLLPVKLEWFKASTDNNKVQLRWKTSYEDNANMFGIYRMSAGEANFKLIGTVKAINNVAGSEYSLEDVLNENGNYTYKLTGISVDNKETGLGIRQVSWEQKNNWRIADMGSAWRITTALPVYYELLDLQGRLLLRGNINTTAVVQKPGSVSIYVMRLRSAGQLKTFKLK